MLPGNGLPSYEFSLPLRLGPVQELGISWLRDHSKRAHPLVVTRFSAGAPRRRMAQALAIADTRVAGRASGPAAREQPLR